MAGTGGTSSSSLLPAELFKLRGFGVGNRDEEGVVLEDKGVETFRGSMEGDLEDCRIVDLSGIGWGGVSGIGGGPCKIDNRFARRASVGLTVLAPSPVAPLSLRHDLAPPGIGPIYCRQLGREIIRRITSDAALQVVETGRGEEIEGGGRLLMLDRTD
ncbi:hypothetical protein M7I_4001 [Glarea lozoyensis 74030]|uniref:Uncharacterized protein n=1 Tax=Glarea lozoyensis (strain ATCC 74030 / MF5533) TaxID=1104152 RepID=H0EN02_GLAL7|nr:hypothetical protein M7I_4001 [Glarea lozoyensis 74030]